MKLRHTVAYMTGFMLAGCSTTASFFPVEGPLADLRPVPEIVANVDGIAGNTGNISMTMPSGSNCQGRWSSAAGAGVAVGAGTLLGQYGTTYGVGYSVSTGSGQNPGQAFMSCADGRTIAMEFVTGAGTANGFGIAKDTEGNIYRVLF